MKGSGDAGAGSSPLASLRRWMRPQPARAQERCELCAAPLAAEHPHLVELSSRRLACACEACGILFSGAGTNRYRRVPRDVQFLNDFRMTDAEWESLGVPIGLAFFMYSTSVGRVVAIYPSPAGATESLLPLDAWAPLVEANPVLGELEPDVEALLANRVGKTREHYRVGIDRCYKLVGLLRRHWSGFSGGTEMWAAIGRFFAELKPRSR